MHNFDLKLISSILSLALIFLIDAITTPGLALWLLYFVPVLLIYSKPAKFVFGIATITSVLMIIGHFIPYIGISFLDGMNRVAGIIAIWIATTLLAKNYRVVKQIQDNKNKLQLVIETLPAGIVFADHEGKIVMANSAAKEIFGGEITGTAYGPQGNYTLRTLDNTLLHLENLPLTRALKKGETTHDMLIKVQFEQGGERIISVNAVPAGVDHAKRDGALAVISDVTGRTRAEQEHLRLLADFKGTIEALPDGLIIYNKDLSIRFINTTAKTILGYEDEDLKLPLEERIERSVIVQPDGIGIPKERYPFVRALKGEIIHNEILRIKTEAQIYWISASAAPIRSPDGEISGTVMNFSDVTDMINLQKTVSESEERFRNMFELHRAIMLLIDPDSGEIQDANQSAAIFYGYTRTKLTTMRIDEINQLPHERINSEMKAAVQEKRPYFKFPHRLANGEIRWVEVYSSPIQIRKKRLLFSIIHDITERKMAEDQLSYERNFIDAVLQTMGALVVVTDQHAGIVRFNRACEILSGYRFDEVQGKSIYDLFIIPEERAEVERNWRQLFSGGQMAEHENYWKTRSGEKRFIRWRNSVLREGYDGSVFTISTGIDITDRLETELYIQKLNRELQQRANDLATSNKDLQSFSYSVSHDLRNPLYLIDNYRSILEEEYGEVLDNEGREFLSRIKSGIEKMKTLIDDLMHLSRVVRHEITRRDVDLSSIVLQYLREMHALQPERNVQFVVSPDIHASADPHLIRIALENLLRNAWKFTSKKPVTIIEFGSFYQNDHTVYYIKDNGVGFDLKFSTTIFEPFKRVHAEKEFGGSGIGLSIVERVIKRHDGKIWAEGEAGKGAIFFFTL